MRGGQTDRQTDRHESHDLLMRIREILLLAHVVVYEVTLVWCQRSLSSGFPSVWGGRCVEGWRGVCGEGWGGRIRQDFTEWFPKWWDYMWYGPKGNLLLKMNILSNLNLTVQNLIPGTQILSLSSVRRVFWHLASSHGAKVTWQWKHSANKKFSGLLEQWGLLTPPPTLMDFWFSPSPVLT